MKPTKHLAVRIIIISSIFFCLWSINKKTFINTCYIQHLQDLSEGDVYEATPQCKLLIKTKDE